MTTLYPSLLCCAAWILLRTYHFQSETSTGTWFGVGYIASLYVTFAVHPVPWYICWMGVAATAQIVVCGYRTGGLRGCWSAAVWVWTVMQVPSRIPMTWENRLIPAELLLAGCVSFGVRLCSATGQVRRAALHTGCLMTLCLYLPDMLHSSTALASASCNRVLNMWWGALLGLELLEQATRVRKGFDGSAARLT